MARNVLIDLIGRDRVSPAFASAAASADRAAGKMTAASARMAKTGATLTKGVTVPLLAVAAVSTKVAIDYQKSMTLLTTAGGESAAKTAAIAKGLQTLAIQTGSTLNDLSAGMYIVAKAGSKKWSATDQLLVMKAAAQGAKAEQVDLGTATTALTSVMASYGIKATDAVKAENMLIRGSALSKTTFADFSQSLANVVPLASSLHISFAQVAGAIATMTQHGETAQRSTENLNNLIRNLAGQNNVASQAMQQLGLNTVDLRKNLAANGLTGTLDMVENALAKNSKGGLVVVSAFKRAQLATASLKTELAAMPAGLQKISAAFETGRMPYSDYYKAVKALGGQQFELGKGFISTMATAKGFSNQLKSGNSDVSTAAQMLQKMLGGATGLNVALMLGGNSAKQFTSNVDQVAAAARLGGADVLGWSKTSSTLAVKMDQAKASLQVLALEIGNALIPAVTKIVGGVRSAVTWFSNLSDGTKDTIMKAALVVAALGPVLAIISRVTRAVQLLWGGFQLLGRAGVAVYGFAAKIIASMTGTTAAVETTAVANASAAAEFATAEAAKATAAAETAVEIAASVEGTTSVLAEGASAAAADAIEFAAAMQAQADAAVAAGAAIVAATETAAAAAGSAAAEVGTATTVAFGPVGIAIAAVVGVGALAAHSLGLFGGNARKAIAPTQALTQAILDDGDAFGKLTRAQVVNTLEGKGAYDQAVRVGIGQKELTDAVLGNAQAQTHISAVLERQGLVAAGAYASGRKLTATQQAQVNAASSLTSTLGFMTTTMRVNKQAADNEAAALGRTTSAAHGTASGLSAATGSGNAYLDAVARINHQPVTPVVNTSSAMAKLNALLAKIPRGTFHFNLEEDISKHNAQYNSARGGPIYGPGTGTSDSIPARLSNGEYVVNARQTAKHRDLLNAINYGAKGFAAGGPVNTAAVGTAIGTVGQAYTKPIDLSSVGITQIRAQLAHATAVLNQQIANGLSKAAATNFRAEIANLTREANAQLAQLKAKIRNVDFGGFVRSLSGTVANTRTSLATLLTDASHAGASAAWIDKVRTAETKLAAVQRQRNTVTNELTAASARLAAAQQKYQQTFATSRQATLNTFDITSAGAGQYQDQGPTGSITGILGNLATTVANARRFATLLRKMIKDGVPKGLVAQLAAAGPGAMAQAQALAAASPAQIATLTAGYGQLSKTSSFIGGVVASDLNGAGVQAAQGLVNGLKSKQSVLNKTMQTLANNMVTTLKHALGIKSPSAVMYGLAGHTVEGYRRGLVDRVDGVKRAAKDLANAATPEAQNAQWKRTEHHSGDTFHIYETHGAGATALAVQRRKQMAGYGSA